MSLTADFINEVADRLLPPETVELCPRILNSLRCLSRLTVFANNEKPYCYRCGYVGEGIQYRLNTGEYKKA